MSWDFITIKKEKQEAKILVEGIAYEVDGESKMRYLLTIDENSITLEISPPRAGYELVGSFIELLGKPDFGPEQEFGGICGEFEEDARLTAIWSLESNLQRERVLNYIKA
jgi:hypothetical protein